MYPHRIRLRGPWEYEVVAEDSSDPAVWHSARSARRATVPSTLSEAGLPGFHGQVRLVRKFGYPGQIDSHERVWLTFAGIEGTAEISLNGTRQTPLSIHHSPLAAHHSPPCEFDVTCLLKPHNRLEVLLRADSDACGLVGEVALEVRCAVFLRDLAVQQSGTGETAVTGQIVGNWPAPLDLYVFLDGKEVSYASITTSGAAQTFRAVLAKEPSSVLGRVLRVDLVEGPSLWFRHEAPIGPVQG